MLWFALLVFAGPASFADTSTEIETDVLDFAFDFCGQVVGGDAEIFEKSNAGLRSATVQTPGLVPDKIPGMRQAVAKSLDVSPDTPVHVVTFTRKVPGVSAIGYLRTDYKYCMVTITGTPHTDTRFAERIALPKAGWQEINLMPGQRAWQRKLDNGQVQTFALVGGSGVSTMSVQNDVDLLPTIAEFDALADLIVLPCAQSALKGGKLEPTRFAKSFDYDTTEPDGRILLISKKPTPGGRLALVPESWGTTCLFVVYKSVFSFDFYRRSLGDAFKKLKGAARSQGADKRWVAPGPDPDNWATLFENADQELVMFVITRD
jgi:hypothetical protein